MKHFPIIITLAAGLAVGAPARAAEPVDFKSQVAPILEQDCIACHDAAKAAGGLAITSREALFKNRSVVPGQPESSSFYTLSALPSDRPGAMPPGGPRLSDEKLEVLKRWIEEGADWPTGIMLKLPKAPTVDKHEVARRIHERIEARRREQDDAGMKPYSVTVPNTTISYDMAPIPAGDFAMGSPDSDPEHKPDEQPAHPVHVDAFWMQAHEVTWDEYRLFMFADQARESEHPDEIVDAVSRPTRPYMEMSFGMGINGFPAISMTQHAANQYAQWLSAKTGEFYRLPTEAEWEYACRAGTTKTYFFGNDPAQLDEFAWYAADSNGRYQKVATKKPNPWGLFDMAGNVMEWTLDQYVRYKPDPATDPWVKATAPYPHAVRGGAWNSPTARLRCASRVASDPSWKQQDPQLPKSIWYHTDAQWLGFRLVRPAKIPSAEEMYNYWNSGVEQEY